MLTNGAFTALILICGHFSHAVPPPSNVTVKCKNLQTTVSWDYSNDQPQTIFWVNITGSTAVGSFEANTAEHQYDLSPFVFGSKERYLSFLVVFVTAVQGGKQSEAVPSKSFSFNQLVTVDIKCSLDFPPVTLHKAEEGFSVNFTNPLHFYNELKRTVTPNSNAALRYTVSSSVNKVQFTESCSGSDLACKLDMTLSAEECVTLKGFLCFEELCDKQTKFKETKEYCSEKHGAEVEGLVTFAILLGFIFLIVIIVAVVLICKVEAWTMKIPVPNIRMNLHGNCERQSFFIPPASPENIQVPIVSPPVETTSLVVEDKNFCEKSDNSGNYYDRWAKGDYLDGGCLEESIPDLDQEGLVSGANGTDDDSPDGSVKTDCVSLSSTEEERSPVGSMKTDCVSLSEEQRSPYDRPHVLLQRDLGDGEPVIGYSGN